MCLRYSSSVVAPTARSSPRASMGLSRLAASTAPSAAPAPTIVWSSSMNRMIWPWASEISLSTALSRSSNSPRYLEPAIRAPMSSAITRRSRSDSGMSPDTIRWARPSTIAVLPVPGSPISTGLFLVRRESTWITRRISSSRPITGSSLPCSAASVRSRPNFSSAWYLSSGFWSVTRCGPRTDCTALASRSRSAPPASSGSCASASRRCSVDTYSSPIPRASSSARASSSISSRPRSGAAGASPVTLGSESSFSLACARTRSGSTFAVSRTGATMPPSCSSRATRRWYGTTSGLRRAPASRWAADRASWDLTVNRSACIRKSKCSYSRSTAAIHQATAHRDGGPGRIRGQLDAVHQAFDQPEPPAAVVFAWLAPGALVADRDRHLAVVQDGIDLERRLAEAVAVLDRVRARLVTGQLDGAPLLPVGSRHLEPAPQRRAQAGELLGLGRELDRHPVPTDRRAPQGEHRHVVGGGLIPEHGRHDLVA